MTPRRSCVLTPAMTPDERGRHASDLVDSPCKFNRDSDFDLSMITAFKLPSSTTRTSAAHQFTSLASRPIWTVRSRLRSDSRRWRPGTNCQWQGRVTVGYYSLAP